MRRQRVPEVMDDDALPLALHEEALRGLRRINALSFAASAFWKPLAMCARKSGRPLRVLDLATGGADVLLALAERARRERVPMEFSGCDKSQDALSFAARFAAERNLNVAFFRLDILADPIPAGFDVVINSLFLHHFDPPQVVEILTKLRACEWVFVSDLRRSRAGLWLAHFATRVLSRSPVVHVDGPRSVHAAYTLPEMLQMAETAGLIGVRLETRWPCRMMLKWSRPR